MRNLCHEWHCWSWFQTEITISVHLVGLKVLLCKKCTWRRGTSSRRFAFSKIHFLFTPKVQEQQRRRHISHYWRRGFSKGFFSSSTVRRAVIGPMIRSFLWSGTPMLIRLTVRRFGMIIMAITLSTFLYSDFVFQHFFLHIFVMFTFFQFSVASTASSSWNDKKSFTLFNYNDSNTKIFLPYKWGLTILS